MHVNEIGVFPGQGSTLNSQAMNRAMQLFESLPATHGAVLHFGPGTYDFADAITIPRPMVLTADIGARDTPTAKLKFPAGSDGLVFAMKDAYGAKAAAAELLWIVGTKDPTLGGSGVVAHCDIRLSGLVVDGFARHGVQIAPTDNQNADMCSIDNCSIQNCGVAFDVVGLEFIGIDDVGTAKLGRFAITLGKPGRFAVADLVFIESPYHLDRGYPYTPDGNGPPAVFHCGIFRIVEVKSDTQYEAQFTEGGDFTLEGAEQQFYLAHRRAHGPYRLFAGHGIFIKGTDSQVHSITNTQFINNTGWGALDMSVAGNTFVSCLFDANTAGPYRVPQAATTMVGCYAEGGQSRSVAGRYVVVRGGTQSPLIQKRFGDHHRFVSTTDDVYFTPMGCRDWDYITVPFDGSDAPETWDLGDRVYNSKPAVGQPYGWTCTVPGTFPMGRTTKAWQPETNGSRLVILNGLDAANLFDDPIEGQWLRFTTVDDVNGPTYTHARIERKSLVGGVVHLVVSRVVPSTAHLLGYSAPVFVPMGTL
jgi:hypothetical protein